MLPQTLPLAQMQTTWASQINPLLVNPLVNGHLLTGIVLSSGPNVINHKLGRQMQGWFVVDKISAATAFRSAPFNSSTLTLTASGTDTVSLWVF
jgi:hypothetical protein